MIYDSRLLNPAFKVPGSYLPANIPSAGVAGASLRTPARQAAATGGFAVMRIARQTARRTPRSAITLPAAPVLPPLLLPCELDGQEHAALRS